MHSSTARPAASSSPTIARKTPTGSGLKPLNLQTPMLPLCILLLFGLSLAFWCYAVTRGIGQNTYSDGNAHGFRQSQTALGVWSILKGRGHELPALGPGETGSWAVPLEMPLYQYLAAAVARAMGTRRRRHDG